MVGINQKQFNDDLGRYLSTIKKDKPISIIRRVNIFSSIKSSEKVPEVAPNEVHVEYKEPSVFRRILTWRRRMKMQQLEEELSEAEKQEVEELEGEIEALEDEEAELEEMAEEVEVQREGLFARLLNKLKISRSEYEEDFDPEEYEEPAPAFDEDVKDILKVTHTWLEKLPARRLQEFKRSPDFEKYKAVLIKYGLVKVPAPKDPITNAPLPRKEDITIVEK